MKLRCWFGHKFQEKRVKGILKGAVTDPIRGVFLLHTCERCGKKWAEFVSLDKRRMIMPEYMEAYAKEAADDSAQ